MDALELKLCDIQGRLFELSLTENLTSPCFITEFMKSEVARGLDSSFNRMQWAGEEYLLDELMDTCILEKGGEMYSKDALYWIGYLYRYWHYITGETSKQILKQASAKTMNINYLMFHTMAPEMAIEDLKEIYRQKHSK